MKLLWTTDIHLNFLTLHQRELFYDKLKSEIFSQNIDAIIISGDIGEYPSVIDYLKELEDNFSVPIYFVLGNHDYYNKVKQDSVFTVKNIRKDISELKLTNILWLNEASPIRLNETTILVGVDSWADGREGDIINSTVRINDDNYIYDLVKARIDFTINSLTNYFERASETEKREIEHKISTERLKNQISIAKAREKLADSDAKTLKKSLNEGIKQYNPEKVIVVTHVPPFKEGAIYNGEISDAFHLPFFCSKVIGDLLLDFAKNHPKIEFLALAGHSHGNAEYCPLENLHCRTQEASYNFPDFEIITI